MCGVNVGEKWYGYGWKQKPVPYFPGWNQHPEIPAISGFTTDELSALRMLRAPLLVAIACSFLFGGSGWPGSEMSVVLCLPHHFHMEVSWNGGSSKSSILMGCSILNQPAIGVPHYYGNLHISTIKPVNSWGKLLNLLHKNQLRLWRIVPSNGGFGSWFNMISSTHQKWVTVEQRSSNFFKSSRIWTKSWCLLPHDARRIRIRRQCQNWCLKMMPNPNPMS